ncbi:uncharacterized protein LOC106674028 isoform X1 [Cimex lectularius]|uniref:Uncharacterized protein n=2 Tax=Cimex lectularius TaxID=79782 RepID=A0A8I6SIC2_CIMLE|nr:uncharacterized protein LOC106674028 isoform X1 [Cimex lectularius]
MFHKFVTLEILFISFLFSCCYSQVLNDDWLRKYLEELKVILKNGDEEMGIPKLDPYFLNYDVVIDRQPKMNATLHVDGVLTNFSDYIVSYAKLEKNLSVSFLLTFINPTFKGRFSINGTAMTVIPVDSEGILQSGFNYLAILVESQIVAQNQTIQMNDISFAYSLDDLKVTVEGLLVDFGFTYLLRDVIYDVVFPLVTKYQNGIQNAIQTTLLSIGNVELKEVGLRSLIEMVKKKYIF